MKLNNELYHQACIDQYYQADNMTDRMAAFKLIVHANFTSLEKEKVKVLKDFYTRWESETLVINQWLSVQATVADPATLEKVTQLLDHPAFSIKNPNKVRALISAFANNPIAFHREDGLGYTFLCDKIIELNAINPQIASRLLTPLTRWRQHLPHQQDMMKAALEKIKTTDNLSPDVFEVVNKSLAG